MRRLLFRAISALLLTATFAQAAPVTGKVAVAGAGVAGVRIAGYPAATLSLSGEAPFVSPATGADGQFSITLPPGSYYLLAQGSDWFSYYGRNPLAVPAEGLADINLPLVPASTPPPEMAVTIGSGIAGRVLHDGKPVVNAIVFVYPDLSSQLKGFGLGMSAPSDERGQFELPLPAGRYYLVARVRHGNSSAGPLQSGDLFGYLPGNPVVVGEGAVTKVSLPVIAVPEKISRHAATMFGQTRVSGTIVDRQGKPLAGLQALLYADEAMLNRPLYVSQPSGPDGTFILSFPSGGTFYLAARNSLGGTPAPGELYGRYQGAGGTALRIETGQALQGLTIVVEEVW
ncbi:MAG: DUF4198 domain-containing protein [Deltaproteobacteria bacterium]|nr:MAG: DUF4198 domain-containing protein [Deltaproteobacteria bacterium]